jgi:hypothetical protein
MEDSNDDNILADFGRTDSVFWRNRLAKTGWVPPNPKTEIPDPQSAQAEYFEDGAGNLFRKDGEVYRQVN